MCCSVLQCVAVCCSVSVPQPMANAPKRDYHIQSVLPPPSLPLPLPLDSELKSFPPLPPCPSFFSTLAILGCRGGGDVKLSRGGWIWRGDTCVAVSTHCNALQHTAMHCNTLQHTAIHSSTRQNTATHSNTRQHTTTHCKPLQHTTTIYTWISWHEFLLKHLYHINRGHEPILSRWDEYI